MLNFFYVYPGKFNVAKLLIESGSNVNTQNKDGLTPLHESSIIGHADLVKLLIESGSELDRKDNEGRTPLYWAAQNGYSERYSIQNKSN